MKTLILNKDQLILIDTLLEKEERFLREDYGCGEMGIDEYEIKLKEVKEIRNKINRK